MSEGRADLGIGERREERFYLVETQVVVDVVKPDLERRLALEPAKGLREILFIGPSEIGELRVGALNRLARRRVLRNEVDIEGLGVPNHGRREGPARAEETDEPPREPRLREEPTVVLPGPTEPAKKLREITERLVRVDRVSDLAE
jgi:hypothetical protein